MLWPSIGVIHKRDFGSIDIKKSRKEYETESAGQKSAVDRFHPMIAFWEMLYNYSYYLFCRGRRLRRGNKRFYIYIHRSDDVSVRKEQNALPSG